MGDRFILQTAEEQAASVPRAYKKATLNSGLLTGEADSSAALARGMKAVSIRVARAINRWRGEKGKVFADRYHVHVLATPREARHALAYLLNNFRKHGVADAKAAVDPCSSAASFDGWKRTSAAFDAVASQASVVPWTPSKRFVRGDVMLFGVGVPDPDSLRDPVLRRIDELLRGRGAS